MNHRQRLVELIQALIAGELSVPQFEKEYYNFYLEQVSSNALTDSESEFFGLVQEKLDWTAVEPDEESRKYGWMNHIEYRNWVAEAFERFNAK